MIKISEAISIDSTVSLCSQDTASHLLEHLAPLRNNHRHLQSLSVFFRVLRYGLTHSMGMHRTGYRKTNNIWKDGIMGVIIGDALGCPVQFRSRREIAEKPVTTMTGYGTYRMPPGTWTDDSSMTLAALDSILERGCINPADIMYRFAAWLLKGDYTPFGEAFDNGNTTTESIIRYVKNPDVTTCGGTHVYDNGNGSLMRIMPVCLYCYEQQAANIIDDNKAVSLIHQISGLTHNHMRSKAACGLYYFLSREIIRGKGTVMERLQHGINAGFAYYEKDPAATKELAHYARLRDLNKFGQVPVSEIKSGGYVVDTLEAAVWSLIRTNTSGCAAYGSESRARYGHRRGCLWGTFRTHLRL